MDHLGRAHLPDKTPHIVAPQKDVDNSMIDGMRLKDPGLC
jgi:hypothetical protein